MATNIVRSKILAQPGSATTQKKSSQAVVDLHLHMHTPGETSVTSGSWHTHKLLVSASVFLLLFVQERFNLQ